MNLYHVSQSQNNTYDTYSDFVVCAPDEETARNTNPYDGRPMTADNWRERYGSWCSGPEHVVVRLVGTPAPEVEPGIVCASFHAG